jgi:hypothetical protein
MAMHRLRLVCPNLLFHLSLLSPKKTSFCRYRFSLTTVVAYDRNQENAPAYLPPQGASKVNPDQGDYASVPPPGAPPLRNDDAPAYPTPVAGSSGREQI